MTGQVKKMLHTMKTRDYRSKRVNHVWDLPGFQKLNEYDQSTEMLCSMLKKQEPLIFDGDIFGFNRYLVNRPGEECRSHTIIDGVKFYERYSNIAPAYNLLIDRGLNAVLSELHQKQNTATGEKLLFCNAAIAQLNAIEELCARYREYAKKNNHTTLHSALCQVPMRKPRNLYEALLFQKILIFVLRCSNYKHITLGRFDQYMYPYYLVDRAAGTSDEKILETIESFFISLNFDSDIYPGVQQGDNGQSMVLGGYDHKGNSQFNELTELCLKASLELNLIDPKINLRVNSTTPDRIYKLGTELTKQGLGFPQYCNDDIIIPGLIKLGYRPEDAAQYAVAACWEPIVPGYSADVPNVTPFSFPLELAKTIHSLPKCTNLDTLYEAYKKQISLRCQEIRDRFSTPETYYFGRPLPISPLMSLMTFGCLETCTDIGRFGARYYNLGAFGAGLSTAVDSISAIDQVIFKNKLVSWNTLIDALNNDFEGFDSLRNALRNAEKMGGNVSIDTIGCKLMEMFSSQLNGKPNGVGGVWRCGTGSAQNYIIDAKNCPATADGRKSGQPYACSFSPAPGAKVSGPLSVIRAFTAFDLTNAVNGGPLTMELHHNVFRNVEGVDKVASLVKIFILSGGHQFQLNTLNREKLLDACKHPENHKDLVVRVWGWSGYFCELDQEYQQHILSRTLFSV